MNIHATPPASTPPVPAEILGPRVDESVERRVPDSSHVSSSECSIQSHKTIPLERQEISAKTEAKARSQAVGYIRSLSPKQQTLFNRHGLTAERLMPLCQLFPDDDDHKKITDALDQLLREVVTCPDDKDLNHHTLHRNLVGGIALVGTGANRWFGLGGLTKIIPAPPQEKKPLAVAVTTMAFLSDNLQGAYGANRTRFEGGGHWTSWLAWGLSLLPTGITATMTFRGIATLGAGPWAAGVATAAMIVGSLPFYYTLTDRLSYTLKGENSAAEERQDRSIWLLSQILKSMGDNDVSIDKQSIGQRCQVYAQTLRLSTRRGLGKKILRQLCIYSPGDKAKNVIRELRESFSNIHDLSLDRLKADSIEQRTQHPWRNLAFSLATMGFLSVPSSWGEAASVTNPLITAFGPFGMCSRAANIVHYIGWQAIVNIMMVSQTVSQAVLVNENLRGVIKQLTNLWQGRHGFCHRMWEGLTPKSVAMKLGNAGIHLLGIMASICFTLSYAGAINTNTREDFCMKDSALAADILPILGSIPVLIATLNMGKEIKQVLIYFYHTLARCCSREQRKNMPWYLQYQTVESSQAMKNLPEDQESLNSGILNEHTGLMLPHKRVESRTWTAGAGRNQL